MTNEEYMNLQRADEQSIAASFRTNSRIIRTIHDIRIGDSVRSRVDGLTGVVVDADGACVKVLWTDGEHSIYHRRDGFVLFAPTQGPAS
jgi:hypothetical protein